MKPGRFEDNSESLTSPAHQFDEIAFLYDDLMAGVPYSGWVEYLQRLLKEHGCKPRTILDLCCGTGTVSLMLAKHGYEITGIDISAGMVEHARRKAEGRGLSVDFQTHDAASFRLGKRFDCVVSLFDSLNYIIEASSLQGAFHCVSSHLHPGGLFIFDMNTELALAGRLFDQRNMGSSAPVLYDWTSSYDPDTRICSVRMNFIYRRQGAEKRVTLNHYQRAYEIEEIMQMLETAGLQVLAAYDAYSLRKVSKRSDRVFFVARK